MIPMPVHMVGYKLAGVNGIPILAAGLPEPIQLGGVVVVGMETLLTTVAALNDMQRDAGQGARRGRLGIVERSLDAHRGSTTLEIVVCPRPCPGEGATTGTKATTGVRPVPLRRSR